MILFMMFSIRCAEFRTPISVRMRLPVSGIYKIKGVGDALAGRVEQGVVK